MAIQCVVVTPERTEMDVTARFVTLPMYDGELGVAPGRAAMIGRLGYGIMRLDTEKGPQRWFIDGGFAQVENDSVSVLTGRAIRVEDLDVAEAEAALEQATELPGGSSERMQIRDTAMRRAQGMIRAARSTR